MTENKIGRWCEFATTLSIDPVPVAGLFQGLPTELPAVFQINRSACPTSAVQKRPFREIAEYFVRNKNRTVEFTGGLRQYLVWNLSQQEQHLDGWALNLQVV